MRFVTAKQIFTGEELLSDYVIVLDNIHLNDCHYATNNYIIRDLIPLSECSQYAKKYAPMHAIDIENVGNGIIAPSFLDLQVNGCGGVLFGDDPTIHTLETMYKTWRKYGTGGFLPTLISSDFPQVIKALQTVAAWFSLYGKNRGVMGLHLEGPFISKNKPGIHSLNCIIPPKHEYLTQIATYAKQFPIMLTIAIEEFSDEQLDYLAKHNVLLSVGHCSATAPQVANAARHGLLSATHLFNAMSGLTARDSGVIGGVLANEGIYAGIIADLFHVEASNLSLAYLLKPNKLYLVTDAVTPVGTTMQTFHLANQELFVKNKRCINSKGTLGGALLTMNEAVKNCVQAANIPLEAALKMASLTPARLLGIDNWFGKIAPNYQTPLIHIDADLHCSASSLHNKSDSPVIISGSFNCQIIT